MNINYDKVADAMYIKVGTGKVSRTVAINENTFVDMDSKENVVGYEILNYSLREDSQEIERSILSGIPVHITQATPVAC